ncbi:MAG TPA: hypothetical protein K8V00_01720 [Ligilactobacillus acidipiscis]|uniref:Baseplate upper protein immunoglobulin like domain-containing protein n=1 Tax=Ligilactobacillus acidipiscis TaxID=89059 RepID=A0A921F6M9_9LACO|nr:hypothetical protein [Ligilactobacillus acidipiscis]
MKLEDKLKEVNSSDYTDPKNITDEDVQQLVDQFNAGNIMQPANTLSDWLSKKLYGHDVRNSLAFWTIIMATIADLMRTDETTFKRLLGDRQDQVEGRQTTLEEVFKEVQQGATDDTEVKTARNSEKFGPFDVLDDRLENIEQILAQKVPGGYSVIIKHNLGRNPTVKAQYYEYAIGTEPDGLGSGPEGSFGGIGYVDVPVEIQYTDANTVVVNMPKNYAMDNPAEFKPDGNWYINQSYKTIQIKLN